MKRHTMLNIHAPVAASALLALAALLLAPTPAQADTCTVTSLEDSGSGTLRDAIADTNCNAINFNLPLPATINLTSGQLTVVRTLTITGPGANLLTIQRDPGGSEFRIFEITGGQMVEISGLEITNGDSPGPGAGILNRGTLTVTNSTFSGNRSDRAGGAMHNALGGTLNVTNSTFSGNHGGTGGGIHNVGALQVINSTFSGNDAGQGGGIFNGSSSALNARNSTFSFNGAHWGGGIHNAPPHQHAECDEQHLLRQLGQP